MCGAGLQPCVRSPEGLRHRSFLQRTLSTRFAIRAVVFASTLGCAALAPSQDLARISLDSVAGIDLFKGTGTNDRHGAGIDISAVVRLHDGWLVYVRPWFFK